MIPPAIAHRRPFVTLARWRRVLAAVAAALAMTCAFTVARPSGTAPVEVHIAARDLTAMSPLARSDTEIASLPRAAVPDGALPASDPVEGHALTAPMRRGEVVTTARVADPPAAGYGSGTVAAPVRIADTGAVALLTPGSRVDVLAAATGGDGFAPASHGDGRRATVVASDRPVIAVPAEEASPTGDAGALIVLAVPPDEARALATHAVSSRLSVTIQG